jgi:tRNA-Thr(GGU) m(6)t(6)A37 methyltransferase TsaA
MMEMLMKEPVLNPVGAVKNVKESESQIEVFPAFRDGLRGIEAFSHLIVLYWAHLRDTKEERTTLLVFPRRHLVNVKTGVFACRSPSRPNPVGLCVVELVKVDGCLLTVEGLDAFAETPIIDIKPYLPKADSIPSARTPKWTSRGPPT